MAGTITYENNRDLIGWLEAEVERIVSQRLVGYGLIPPDEPAIKRALATITECLGAVPLDSERYYAALALLQTVRGQLPSKEAV